MKPPFKLIKTKLLGGGDCCSRALSPPKKGSEVIEGRLVLLALRLPTWPYWRPIGATMGALMGR